MASDWRALAETVSPASAESSGGKRVMENGGRNARSIDEIRDVHPIFRGNPHWIIPGAKLERGEKFLLPDGLRRIDLLLRDPKGLPCYTEIKWSSIDRRQIREYREALDRAHPNGSFRLIWAVPDDLESQLLPEDRKLIEVVIYSREKVTELVEWRHRSQEVLTELINRCQDQVEVTIYGERIRFNNIIEACYFVGRVTTDKGIREIGMRKQGAGRYLDLLVCVASSPWAPLLPELAANLVNDLLLAPYYFETRAGGKVEVRGFLQHVRNNERSTYWKPIAAVVEPIAEKVGQHAQMACPNIERLYQSYPGESDLLLRALSNVALSAGGKDLLTVKLLIDGFANEFHLRPTQPVLRVKHSGLGQNIENSVSAQGYESDMSKRLVELCALRRLVTPVAGIAQMWVLTPFKRGDRWMLRRSQCQHMRLNRDTSTYLSLDIWR